MFRSLSRKLRGAGFAMRLAVSILSIFLIFFNLGLWALTMNMFRLQEEASEETLRTGMLLLSSSLNADELYFISGSYDPILEATDFETLRYYEEQDLFRVRTIRDSLAEASIQDSGTEYRVRILSPDGFVVLDKEGLYTEPVVAPWLQEDLGFFRSSIAGNTSITPYNRDEDRPGPQISRRAYRAIIADDGNGNSYVTGVIQIELSEKVSRAFLILPRRLTLIALVSITLIALLWIFLNRTISRSLKLQLMAEQTDRLRALGGVTAGVAHEIRNPLGIILLTVEEMQAILRKPVDEKGRESLRDLATDVQSETKRLEDLTEQFLSFSRGHVKKQSDIRKLKPFADMTEDTVKLFRKTIPARMTINHDNQLDTEITTLEENHWRQILINILQNSRDACEKTGTITITQKRVDEKIETTIKDNGAGMDPQTLAHIFDPFFTTKQEGTGLGLPLGKRLIEDAQGTIQIQSQPKKGTEVKIILPVFKRKSSRSSQGVPIDQNDLAEPSDF